MPFVEMLRGLVALCISTYSDGAVGMAGITRAQSKRKRSSASLKELPKAVCTSTNQQFNDIGADLPIIVTKGPNMCAVVDLHRKRHRKEPPLPRIVL